MGLLSKFSFGSKTASSTPTPAAGASSDTSELAREARVRARRRLIGASLLLGVGIVGFPLLFESRPRPIPVDIPIEIPAREGLAPLAAPVAHAKPREQAQPVDELPASAALGEREVIEQAPAKSALKGAGAAVATGAAAVAAVKLAEPAPPAKPAASKPEPKPVAKPEPKPEPKPVVKPDTKPEPKAVAKPEPKPEPKPVSKPEPKAEVKPAAKPAEHAADEGRYVVQIGAFAEATGAREARSKVEGLGLKTYTQVIESATGRRIRVRVGPYPTKAEADKAAARIKSSGLPAAVLVL